MSGPKPLDNGLYESIELETNGLFNVTIAMLTRTDWLVQNFVSIRVLQSLLSDHAGSRIGSRIC